MKSFKLVTLLLVVVLVATSVFPAYAQLGGTQKSSFSIQNISDTAASVTVTFIDASGASITPPILRESPELTNPFTLAAGEAIEIYVPSIPDLPDGQYSVVISSDQQIVATANLLGEGNVNFNGTYSGLDEGSQTFYLPAFLYNFYGWYSAVTVQNVGMDTTDVTLTVNCSNGESGTYTASDVPPSAAVTFDSKETMPTGFSGTSVSCDGSAVVASTTAPVVAVDNQTVPTQGFTQSFNGVAGGAQTLYAPVLFVDYFRWDSSINIQKVGTGSTDVTVTYSDGGTSTITLTDATPGHLFYMPVDHPLPSGAVRNLFAATITSDTLPIVAVVNSATDATGQAQTYNAISSGGNSVLAPGLFKSYYGWISSVTCQNIGSVDTTMTMTYSAYPSEPVTTDVIGTGGTHEFLVFSESFLPDQFVGGATITANASGAEISCVINHNNPVQMDSTVGDWSTSANAFSTTTP